MVGTMAQAWCSNASLVHAPSAFPFPSPPLSDHYSSSSLFFFFLFKSCPPCHTYSSSSPFSSSWRWGLRAGRGSMDVGALEAERLRLDSQARARMAQQAAGASSSAVDPRAWKWAIRKRVWDLLEAEGIAREPRPVHHRIPNFSGADAAAAKVASLLEFQDATVVKVNPDTPQRQVRYLVLRGGKKLVTPQPRLRTGFFSFLEPHTLNPKLYHEASTMAGVTKYGKPVGINAKFKVDLLVVGSVAVDPTTGARLGKGEGFAELEYGMLRHMGAIDDFTLIVTSVHDKQLVSDIPVEKLFVHDVPVDVICTPTQIIQTHTSIPKPEGIYWDKLSPQKLSQIKVLQELKKQIEKETGEEICIGADEPLPPLPERKVLKPYAENSGTTNPGLVIWSFDELVTPEELHAHLDKLGITAVKIDVFPESGPIPAMARVYLPGGEDINKLISLIDKTEIRGRNICCQIDKASERQSHRRWR